MKATAIRLAACAFPLALMAAEPPAPQPPQVTPAAAAPAPSPSTVAIPTLARSLEGGLSRVRLLERMVKPSPVAGRIETSLPGTSARIAAMESTLRLADPDALSFREVDRMRVEWLELDATLAGWESSLEGDAKALDDARQELKSLDETWRGTVAAESGDRVPAVLIERIDALLLKTEALRQTLRDRATALLLVQDEVSADRAHVSEALAGLDALSSQVHDRLFAVENDPLWSALLAGRSGDSVAFQALKSWRTSAGEMVHLLSRHRGRFLLQLVLFGVLGVAGSFLVRRVRGDERADPDAKKAVAFLLDRPLSAACILALFATFWIYPPSAVALHVAALTLLILPFLRFIPSLAQPAVRAPAYALTAVFVLDRVHDFALPHSLFSRLALLAIGCLGIACWGWALRIGGRRAPGEPPPWPTRVRVLVRIAIGFLVVAIVANLIGNVSLADQLTIVAVKGAFAGGILYIVARILESLWVLLLAYQSSRGAPMVVRHRQLLERRGRLMIRALAVVTWITFVLWIMRVIEQSGQLVVSVLKTKWTVGNLHIGLGAIVAFAVALSLGIVTARFLRFILDEAVFPRMTLPRGVAAAISATVRYLVILVGLVMAFLAAGLEMSQFTFLAGAFGVGIGFGLQNVVNNFVSGIILLYERPIQVGDVLDVGGVRGHVRRIGIRSSTLSTFDGAEVIVPNANLISANVVNWTLSDRIRRVDIKVNASYGSDPREVLALLVRVAKAHTGILASPEPAALFIAFGESSLEFELRFWTPEYDEWVRVGSDVRTSIFAAFKEAGIQIPFPQRELHVRSPAPGRIGQIHHDDLAP